jgi:hypothetical protein
VARKSKWAFVFGLAGQPFWFTMAISHHLWGLLALNFGYAGSWAYGFYNWWFKSTTFIVQPKVLTHSSLKVKSGLSVASISDS